MLTTAAEGQPQGVAPTISIPFCVLCIAISQNLRGLRKHSEDSPQRRGVRGVKNSLIKIYSELCELRVSAVKSLLLWLRRRRAGFFAETVADFVFWSSLTIMYFEN